LPSATTLSVRDGRTVKDDDGGDDDDDDDGFDARTPARCGRGRTRECRWTRERRLGDDVDETQSDDGRRRRRRWWW
jgi:hypothetical protein